MLEKRKPWLSRKIDKPDHSPLYMDNNIISTVSEHKHFGLVISDNRSWEKEKNINLLNFTKWPKKMTPHYIVPQTFGNIHDYSTRNAFAIPVVHTRTSLYYNSFIPYSVWLWNLQPDNIRLSPSIQALKYSLNSNISSKRFYYYTGSRLGQILHSRLRMQCSSLN